MAKKRIDIYDSNGFVETIYEDQPDIEINVEDIISSKEEELIRIYNEIQALKNR